MVSYLRNYEEVSPIDPKNSKHLNEAFQEWKNLWLPWKAKRKHGWKGGRHGFISA